jgi:hypothetical protein
MTFVCLSNLAIPTGGASAAELAPLLLERAPRVRVDGAGDDAVIWADGRGLQGRSLATALLARLRLEGCAGARAGVASAPIVALVAARHAAGDGEVVEVPLQQERAFLDSHPIRVLAPLADLAALLDGTGLECCADLARLDQAAVEVRFGGAGVALWRLARGEDRRLLFGIAPRPLPHASLEWTDYVLRDPERLLFVINRLVASVTAPLRELGQGARAFTLVFGLASGGAVEHPFHPSRPSADQRAWVRLVRNELERVRLPDAVTGVTLRVDAVLPSESAQGDLLDRGFATARAAEEALARLLDQGATVVAPRTSRHPLLRRRSEWVTEEPALVWARPQIGPGDTEPALALHLLPEPKAVEVETTDRRGYAAPLRYRDSEGGVWHDLVTASGPDCISGGQWESAYAYELYCCVRADGELVQLARDAKGNGWEVQGMWR